jgi:hypothetical protein
LVLAVAGPTITAHQRRRAQADIARRQRKLVLTGAGVLAVLLVTFGVVAHLVPGAVNRTIVVCSVALAITSPSVPECAGPLYTRVHPRSSLGQHFFTGVLDLLTSHTPWLTATLDL